MENLTNEQLQNYWMVQKGIQSKDKTIQQQAEKGFTQRESNGYQHAAKAIELIISKKFPDTRIVDLYHLYETRDTRMLITRATGIVQGGNVSPLEIDPQEGTLSIPKHRRITGKLVPNRQSSFFDALTTYQPNGETGKLLAQCVRGSILTFGGSLSGPSLGFGRILYETFVFYENDPILKEACGEVANEINAYSKEHYSMIIPPVEVRDSKYHHDVIRESARMRL